MKKLWTAIIAVALCLPLSLFAFAACDEKPAENQNSQTETDSETEDGAATASKELYRQVYKQMADLLLEEYIAGTASAALTLRAEQTFAAPEDIYTEDAGGNMWFVAASAYVYLVSELYQNDSFAVTDKTVTYTLSYTDGDYVSQTSIAMTSEMDETAGKILLQFDYTTENTENGQPVNTETNYIYVDAGYDFAEKQISSLVMHIYNTAKSSLVVSARYSGGELRLSNAAAETEVTQTASELYQTFRAKMTDTVPLGDFSAEYAKANEYVTSHLMP